MKPRLEARVYYKNRLICVGNNSYTNTSKLQRKYGGSRRPFVHAELDAIRKTLYYIGVDKLRMCELRIERLKANGQTGLAKPCDCCQRALEAFKFKEVWFTTERNWEKL